MSGANTAIADTIEVKPLEWEKHPNADLWRAYGLLGPVSIYAGISQISWAFDGFDGITHARGDAGSVDEAMSLAQADYAKRILSAVTLSTSSQPSSPAGRDEVIEACVVAVEEVREQLGQAGVTGIEGEANAQLERNLVGPFLDAAVSAIRNLKEVL